MTEVNDAPSATNDALSAVAEDSGQRTILGSTLTGNDSAGPANESGQTLTVTAVSNVVGGSASVSGGNVLFTPTANFNGAASFDYTVTDNGTTNGTSAPLTATGHGVVHRHGGQRRAECHERCAQRGCRGQRPANDPRFDAHRQRQHRSGARAARR